MPIAGVVGTVDTRARARSDQQKGITPCSTLKANLPDSDLDRLCYKNGPFVSSGLLGQGCNLGLDRREDGGNLGLLSFQIID